MNKDILKLIDMNARISTHDIAAMLNMAEEDVIREICEMEADNVICGYATLINWDKVDDEDSVTALIEVKVTPQRGDGFDRIAERIYKFEEVENVYLMSGSYDLTVIINGKNMREVSSFVSGRLATMESVISTATHFILKKYKEHGIALCEKNKDERMLITP